MNINPELKCNSLKRLMPHKMMWQQYLSNHFFQTCQNQFPGTFCLKCFTTECLEHISDSGIFYVENIAYKKKIKVSYQLRVNYLTRYLEKLTVFLRSKRGLSPIFATILLASIVIIFGSVAYYYSTNLTTTATNNYVSSISGSQQSLAERIGFENIVYINTTNPLTLKIYIINSGSANNLQIDTVFLYTTTGHNLVIPPIQGSATTSSGNRIFPLFRIDDGTSIQNNSLNAGAEGYFTASLSGFSGQLQSGSYTIHVITQSGSAFDDEFTV
jgi:hypothetical protein